MPSGVYSGSESPNHDIQGMRAVPGERGPVRVRPEHPPGGLKRWLKCPACCRVQHRNCAGREVCSCPVCWTRDIEADAVAAVRHGRASIALTAELLDLRAQPRKRERERPVPPRRCAPCALWQAAAASAAGCRAGRGDSGTTPAAPGTTARSACPRSSGG